MANERRFQMPRLERDRPYRGSPGVLRESVPGKPKRPRKGGPLTSSEDVVLQAVKLSYKIADEQIAKGQEMARRLRGASLRSDLGDVGTLVDHGLRLAREFAVLLVEVAETGTHPQAVLRNIKNLSDAAKGREPESRAGRGETPAAKPATGAGFSGAQSIPIQVKSSKGARVTLNLYRALDETPDVYPLYCVSKAADAGAPSLLTTVRFEKEAKGSFILHVEVPAEQASGTYRGYAIDPRDQQPFGTIEIILQ